MMKKIISLFQRNYDGDRLVRDEVVPGAEWVINGEGTATRKWDGTCCMIKEGILYKRYDVKHGRIEPHGFIPAQDPDEKTGHWPGWVMVDFSDPSDKWHVEAFTHYGSYTDGTYELCGLKIQGNPEGFEKHVLIKHGMHMLDAPRNYHELKEWFGIYENNIEGIVWHHKDGRMVKIKKKDFGYKR
jgi:hypothetical protein